MITVVCLYCEFRCVEFQVGRFIRLIWLRLRLCWDMLVGSAVVCGSFFGFDMMFVYRCDAGLV